MGAFNDSAVHDFDERVYDVVELIPPGRVMSYGDIAEYLGGFGPRRVARAMARCGGAMPWHRVLRSDGTAAPGVAAEQLARLRAEGAPVRGGRVDMGAARWDGGTLPRDDRGSGRSDRSNPMIIAPLGPASRIAAPGGVLPC